MSATETIVASLPLPIFNQEVIDVDALEDDPSDTPVFSGFHRSTNGGSSRRISDMLAEEGLAYTGFRASSTSARRSPPDTSGARTGSPSMGMSEDVIVLESDDEGAPSSSTRAGRRPNRTRLRLVSPPPPRAQRGNTPAVPALPPHLASQSSLPRRRPQTAAQDHNPPPIIRPSADPLPFETRMAPLPRLPPRSSPALVAAPRSHYHPAMGLGGAALVLNRQTALEEANRRERDARSNTFNLPSFTDIFRRVTSGQRGPDAPQGADGVGTRGRSWQRWWPWLLDDPHEGPSRNQSPFSDDDTFFVLPDFPPPRFHKQTMEMPVHWKPEYTHPDKAGPGFAYDFAPSDAGPSLASGASSPTVIVLDEDEAGPSHAGSSSSSATAVETTLVCARCLDPLVLAAPASAPEDERRKYRVWALRCGHMLDGKCIAELCAPLPPPSPPPAEQEPVADFKGKGKGKARAGPDVEADAHLAEPEAASMPTIDRKGKRKAVEPPEPESPSKRLALADPAPSPPEGNSIRSRLRSHTRLADASSTHVSTSVAAATPPSRRNQRSGHTVVSGPGTGPVAGRGKGKGKGRAKVERKPAIEAEHEWKCPVAGCGRVHYGVRMQGEWRNDEGRGGIALFI
ncbi:hypothetical protein BD311DRAFT_685043 [Dichomitus squalens]|uniref:Uncharacterized protein n=1 Tax=Dichomitus squalens TaxID=114155 RepID=A0A4Q9N103_9APHY|nr:hypothetical protein BD311DRAFT_685043 [Dichomitus squalens]